MIRNLKEMGMSNREIARQLGVSRNTVSRMLKKTRIQEKKKRHRGSKLDPYRETIQIKGGGGAGVRHNEGRS